MKLLFDQNYRENRPRFRGSGIIIRGLFSFAILSALFLNIDAQNLVSVSELENLSDDLMREYLKENESPDAVVSIVYGDTIDFQKGFGWEDALKTAKVSPETTAFSAASVSKVFVAVAILQLVDRGEIKLSDSVNSHLKTVKLDSDKTTVWNLLTHTGGLDHMLHSTQFTNEPLMPMSQFFEENMSETVIPPGTQINYSNYGMALAGHLVETVTGMEFSDYAEQFIFVPLGMNRSTFKQPVPAEIGGKFGKERFDYVEWVRPYPAATLLSTSSDMSRFMKMLLGRGKLEDTRILSEKSADQLFKRQFSPTPQMPGIGLGFFESEINGRQVFFHTGSKDHFAIMAIIPELQLAVYMAIDAGHTGSNLRLKLVNKILEKYFPKKTPFKTKFEDQSLHFNPEEFSGQYRFNLLAQNTSGKVAGLISDMPIGAGEKNTLVADGKEILKMFEPDLFRASDGTYVYFKRDRSGTVSEMFINSPLKDTVSLKRLQWWETKYTHLIIAGSGSLTILLMALLNLIMFIKRLLRKTIYFKNAAQRILWFPGLIAILFYFAAPVSALILILNTTHKTDVRLSQITEIVSFELKIASVFSAICILALPWILLKKYWATNLRFIYAIFGFVMIPFLWSMYYWNII